MCACNYLKGSPLMRRPVANFLGGRVMYLQTCKHEDIKNGCLLCGQNLGDHCHCPPKTL